MVNSGLVWFNNAQWVIDYCHNWLLMRINCEYEWLMILINVGKTMS